MGRVYLASSPAGRLAAVKVISPAVAGDPVFRERFRREVAAARRIAGAFTAPVADADPDGRQPWLATQYVPGPSLRDAVEVLGPLELETCFMLGARMLEALMAVHRDGLAHRDLKPSNVLLAADGPRLIDFGIARAADQTTLTRTGEVFGTAAYMSPEQAMGDEVGPACDVFAFALVLIFASTGRDPYGSGDPAALLFRIVHDLPDLRDVPAALRERLRPCLAKDPAVRPAPATLLKLFAADLGPSPAWPPGVARLIREREAEIAAWLPAAPRSPAPAGAARPALPPAPASQPDAAPGPGPRPPVPPGPAPLKPTRRESPPPGAAERQVAVRPVPALPAPPAPRALPAPQLPRAPQLPQAPQAPARLAPSAGPAVLVGPGAQRPPVPAPGYPPVAPTRVALSENGSDESCVFTGRRWPNVVAGVSALLAVVLALITVLVCLGTLGSKDPAVGAGARLVGTILGAGALFFAVTSLRRAVWRLHLAFRPPCLSVTPGGIQARAGGRHYDIPWSQARGARVIRLGQREVVAVWPTPEWALRTPHVDRPARWIPRNRSLCIWRSPAMNCDLLLDVRLLYPATAQRLTTAIAVLASRYAPHR